MLSVRNIKVVSFDTDYLDLFWEIAPTTDDVRDYEFYVLRSESVGGPWDAIAGPIVDGYHFRDTSVKAHNKWRQYHYVIKTIQRSTTTEVLSDPASREAEAPLDAIEMRRVEYITFKEHNGRKAIMYPAKTFGQRCHCVDPISETRTVSKCKTCFDTGWVGGYLKPLEILIQIDPNLKKDVDTVIKKVQAVLATARMPSFPTVKPNDIIIEADNKRWKVKGVTGTERLRANVHQELSMGLLPSTHITYKLPVHVDVLSFDPSPEREYTNPQQLEPNWPSRDSIFRAFGSS